MVFLKVSQSRGSATFDHVTTATHRDKSSVGLSTILSAFYRLLRFHLGTAAFGSLIIAIIQMIRIVLKYLEHKVKDWEKKGCSGPLLYILKGALSCAQSLVVWAVLTHNAVLTHVRVSCHKMTK